MLYFIWMGRCLHVAICSHDLDIRVTVRHVMRILSILSWLFPCLAHALLPLFTDYSRLEHRHN